MKGEASKGSVHHFCFTVKGLWFIRLLVWLGILVPHSPEPEPVAPPPAPADPLAELHRRLDISLEKGYAAAWGW